MNEYDSNRILDLVKKIDYRSTETVEETDCYVLNTCHIREKATDKVYHDIGRVKKKFKNKKKPIVIIAGCVAQAEGDILLKKEKYIDAIIGPQSYHQFNKILINIEKNNEKTNFTEFDVVEKFDTLNNLKVSDGKVSTFITIQEGCDKFCKFCVVPYTRGAEFSRSIEEIKEECTALVSNGAREITLLGQNVNAYSFQNEKLSDLIKKISNIKDLKRIRYTTSHPVDFSNDLINIYKDQNKLMPLIHLPVQSGSNKVLGNMNRKHTKEDYLNIIYKLKKINSSIHFSSDFIIGYPGETEKDFNDTLELVKEVKFINSYSFIYSPRPGTPAAKMKQVEKEVAKERLSIFQKLSNEIKMNFRKKFFKKKTLVLFENKTKNRNEFFGRDEYLNSVIVKSSEDLKGKIKEVTISKGNPTTLYGEINQKIDEKVFAA